MLLSLFVSLVLTLIAGSLLYYRALIRAPDDGRLALSYTAVDRLPSFMSRLPGLLASAALKSPGSFSRGFSAPPAVVVSIAATPMQARHLETYMSLVFGGDPRPGAPVCPTYMAGLTFPAMLLTCSIPCFPLSPLCLIHVRSAIQVWREIDAAAAYAYEVRLDGAKSVPLGIEIYFVVVAREAGGDVVWRCRDAILSRRKGLGLRKRKPREAAAPHEAAGGGFTAPLRIGSGVGNQFAALTGDYSPLHVSRLGAIAFGFKRKIAHGRYTFARCLSELGRAGAVPGPPLEFRGQFKSPVYQPGHAELHWDGAVDAGYHQGDRSEPAAEALLHFRLVDARDAQRVHVLGSVKRLRGACIGDIEGP